MIKKTLFCTLVSLSSLSAHSAFMACFDNGDNTISCEGGFSDGSSSSGVDIYIKQNDKTILALEMNEDSEVTFNKPNGSYTVNFDAGEGHFLSIKSENIVE